LNNVKSKKDKGKTKHEHKGDLENANSLFSSFLKSCPLHRYLLKDSINFMYCLPRGSCMNLPHKLHIL